MSNSLPIFFFVFLAIGITVYLYFVLQDYPLRDFAVRAIIWMSLIVSIVQITDIEWTKEWLYMAILNYYGAAICLSAIAVSSEGCVFGTVWALGFFLIGSPVCCCYMIHRLWAKGIVLGGGVEVVNDDE